MMCMCLNKSLTASAKASLLTYQSEYTVDGVEYSPLMYKVIMHLATIDSVATTQNPAGQPAEFRCVCSDV